MVRINGRNGWRASAADMVELLGLKRTAKLPKEGMPEREIQGVRVYVKPSTFVGRGYSRGGLRHRVFAICDCGRHVPVGRLHQHKCKGVTPDVMLAEGRF